MDFPRLSSDMKKRFDDLTDITETLSDAMDNLGLNGAIAASTLRPALSDTRLFGQAVTVRNVERTDGPQRAAASGKGKMGEHEAYNLAEPGDVIVIEGLSDVSNMGGQSCSLAHRAGCAGAVIDGSFRDPSVSRELHFPIWARGITPITGKWRLETVEINGRVRIAGVSVDAGDLVAADEAGIVFIPFVHAEAVLVEAEKINAGDSRQKSDIAAGIDLATLAVTKYK